MASISNHEGSSKKVPKIHKKVDRISSLPDSLLIQILSFLPTKDAVGTSIPSSRWKPLRASVPNLYFEFNLHSEESFSDFMNFVDRVLHYHHLSSFQKFRLYCDGMLEDGSIDLTRIYTWIRVAIKRGVQELDIHLDPQDRYLDLPLSLFTCPTLLALKLGPELRFYVPDSAHFKSLKILHLSLKDPNSYLTENVFRSCPVLEHLSIKGIIETVEELIFDVTTPTLKSFELNIFTYDIFYYDGDKIVVNAPILEYFSLYSAHLSSYVLKNLTSLVKADIDVGHCCIKTGSTKQHADRVFVLLREICSVKYLSLGTRKMGALDYADDNQLLLIFTNLNSLELYVNNCYGWKRLLHLLNSMPILEHLVLEKLEYREDGDFEDFTFVEQDVAPSCLSRHLQEIEITGFRGLSDELKLIEYFLRNGIVLHKLAINSSNSKERHKREFLKKLLMFPRGSRNCQIFL